MELLEEAREELEDKNYVDLKMSIDRIQEILEEIGMSTLFRTLF